MEWWQVVLLAIAIVLVALALAGFLLWRKASTRTREIGERLARLPWSYRIKLARRLMTDGRVPLVLRAIPPLLVLYLATPLDLVPDFIPVLGQLDDILVVIVAIGLLTRFVPLQVIDSQIARLEVEVQTEESP